MLRHVFGCALCAALWVTVAAASRAAITQEGGVSITPGTVQVGLSTAQSPTSPAGDGRLWITPPSTLAANTMIVGSPQGQTVASGDVFVQGGAVTLTEGLYIGRTAGNGSVAISDGGLIAANAVRIGGDTTTNPTTSPQGILTIDGPGSKLRYGFDLSVGSSSDGQLIIRNGGAATSQQTTAAQQAYIGRFAGSTGVATVEGAGSLWQHGGDIVVGGAGAGTLRITSGGVVTSNGGRIASGEGSLPSSGSVLIDGAGSRWSVNILDVGRFGPSANGEIIITNGGTLDQASQSGKTTIGSGGYGRIVVNGPTSRWLHPGTPSIGVGSGGGELFLENGTQFTSAGIQMSDNATSRVVVRGETTRWTSTSQLYFGNSLFSQAAIEVLDGATLNMSQGSSITIGVGGRLLLDRGRISPALSRGAMKNAGLIQGGGFIGGFAPLINTGRILVGPGQRLQIAGSLAHNAVESFNVIEINGGELEAGSLISNLGSRIIADNATFRTMGLPQDFTSKGTVVFAHGRNRVFGPFNNSGDVVVAAGAEVEFYSVVTNTGPAVMSAAAGSKVTMFYPFRGSGIGGPGDVYLEKFVQPGAGPGAMNFGGDVYLGGASQLQIEIAGTNPGVQFDQLTAVGKVAVSGALQLTALAGINANAMLPIVRAGELTGSFTSIPSIGANIGGGVRFNGITYDYNRDEVLVSLSPGIAADFNLDGEVSGADLLVWQRSLGAPCEPGVGADANCDGYVDGADLAVWSAGMAAAASQSATQSAVPEPTSVGLFFAGVVVFSPLGVRRRIV